MKPGVNKASQCSKFQILIKAVLSQKTDIDFAQ